MVVLNELLNLDLPYSSRKNGVALMYDVVNSNLRPEIDPSTPPIIADLIRSGFDREPQARPSFKEIIDILASVPENVKWPFNPLAPTKVRTKTSTSIVALPLQSINDE